jgi:hypothetical protein
MWTSAPSEHVVNLRPSLLSFFFLGKEKMRGVVSGGGGKLTGRKRNLDSGEGWEGRVGKSRAVGTNERGDVEITRKARSAIGRTFSFSFSFSLPTPLLLCPSLRFGLPLPLSLHHLGRRNASLRPRRCVAPSFVFATRDDESSTPAKFPSAPLHTYRSLKNNLRQRT